LRLVGRFDGRAGATLTITQDGPDARLSVRPLGSRREFSADLGAIAHRLIYDAHRADHPIRAGALRPHEPQPKPRRQKP
jgi:hypothetical protein